MKLLEVNCITRTGGPKDHGHITHIGYNVRATNPRRADAWRLTVQQAIAHLESGTSAFYTVHRRSSLRAYLGVVKEPGKPPYLMARVGGVWNDHLLTQTECESEGV